MAAKRLIFIGITALLIVVFFARAAHRARAAAVGSKSQTMQFDGRTRRYILHVPTGYATSNPTALVLVLHGATQSPASAETISRFAHSFLPSFFFSLFSAHSASLRPSA